MQDPLGGERERGRREAGWKFFPGLARTNLGPGHGPSGLLSSFSLFFFFCFLFLLFLNFVLGF
jgi:hypothetical protein